MLLTEPPRQLEKASKTGENLNPLHEDGPKSGDGSPGPSQSPSQSKGFEDEAAALKGVHGHAQKDTHVTRLPRPRRRDAEGGSQSAPRGDEPDRCPIAQVPDYPASARKLEGISTLRSRWRSRSTPRTEQAAELYGIGVAQVRTLLRPDGEQKADARLAPDWLTASKAPGV